MTELDWLQEVYKDYCSKHGLDHVSTCEQSGLTPEQWTWIERFNEQWDKAQEESDVKRMAQNSETFISQFVRRFLLLEVLIHDPKMY